MHCCARSRFVILPSSFEPGLQNYLFHTVKLYKKMHKYAIWEIKYM
jgi:hypothetical protein